MATFVLAPANYSKIPDLRLESRGHKGRRQGSVSEAFAIAVPEERQMAYDGYKSNIDMFLAATARGEKLSCTLPGIDIDFKEANLKLPPPDITVAIRNDLSSTNYETLKKNLAGKSGLAFEEVKGNKKYPRMWRMSGAGLKVCQFLRKFFVEEGPRIEGTSRVEELEAYLKIEYIIELYLRTNTYPAFRDDDEERTYSNIGYGTGQKRATAVRGEKAKRRKVTTTDLEEIAQVAYDEDESMDVDTSGDINDTVYVAKPSPASSPDHSISTPMLAPNLPGMLFPYFDGMNSSDATYVKNITATLFLRLFGSDPKPAVIEIRQRIGGFTSTPSGLVLTHILKGVEISLEAQGQLHLLVDSGKYLGFVVYGAKWSLVSASKVLPSASASALTSAIRLLKGHSGVLEDLIDVLKKDFNVTVLEDDDGDIQGWEVAEALAKVRFSGNDENVKQQQKKLEDLVYSLDFGTVAERITSQSILEALGHLSDDESSSFDQHVHFPPARLYQSLLGSRAGIIFSRFGAKGPSLLVPHARTVKTIDSLFIGDTTKAKEARNHITQILVAIKPMETAISDLRAWRSEYTVTSDVSERAGGYRHVVLKAGGKNEFIKGIAELKEGLFIENESVKGRGKGGRGQSDIMELDEAELDFE